VGGKTRDSVKHWIGCKAFREAQGRVRGDGVESAFGYWPGYGTPGVALHGLTASYMTLVGLAECIAGRRALLALYPRGRGDSDEPHSAYGMAQHARDVAAAMRAMDIGPAIVGHFIRSVRGCGVGCEIDSGRYSNLLPQELKLVMYAADLPFANTSATSVVQSQREAAQ